MQDIFLINQTKKISVTETNQNVVFLKTAIIIIYYLLNLFLTLKSIKDKFLPYNDGLPRPNPFSNPNATGPIVRRPMGLPITSGCDTARDQTRVCSDASSTEMQCSSYYDYSTVVLQR